MNHPDESALHVLIDYKDAVFEKNLDALIALYDDNVVIFDMWGTWSHNGIDAWRQMAASWFDSLGTERVVVDFSDARSIVDQDLALIHAFVTYTAVDAGGEELRSLDNRISLTLKHSGDKWRIIHEHTSAPIDFETTKAMFKRG